MAKVDGSLEAVSVVMPVSHAGNEIGKVLADWLAALESFHREYELLLVVCSSSQAETRTRIEESVGDRARVKILSGVSGYGAGLRLGLGESKYPLVFITAADYPYTPADLGKLLSRINEKDEFLGRKLDLVCGVRTGRPIPAFWNFFGKGYRLFCRIALGLPLEQPVAWLGLREHLRSWIAWGLFANPFVDPNCAFKLFRRSVFDKFPIQSDGDFVHVELIAKSTFTMCLVDEVPLTPKPDAIPKARWTEFFKVFNNPTFTSPVVKIPT